MVKGDRVKSAQKYMGFYKNVNTSKKKKREDKVGFCRHCNSGNVKYIKVIGWGEQRGEVHHYKLICKNCGMNYFVKRKQEIFEVVKDEPWYKTRAYKKLEAWQKGERFYYK